MRYSYNAQPELIERAMAALCYLSCGLIGLIYILFSGKHARAPFFYFHFLQSIILGIFSCLLAWTETAIRQIVSGMLGLIFGLFAPAPALLGTLNLGIDWVLSAINWVAYLLMIYGFIFAILGKYAEIPGLSKIVYRQMQ